MTLAEYKNQNDAQRLSPGTVKLQQGEYKAHGTIEYNGVDITSVTVDGFPHTYVMLGASGFLYSQAESFMYKCDRILVPA